MEMQKVPVRKALHQSSVTGNRWQMPPLQKYGVQTSSVNRMPSYLAIRLPPRVYSHYSGANFSAKPSAIQMRSGMLTGAVHRL